MMTTHQVAYLQDLKYSPMVSATALGLMLGMSILGRIISGILGMRFKGRHLAAVFMACMGLGIVSLMNAGEIFFVYLYSILTGIGFGGMIVLLPIRHGRLLRTQTLFPDCRLDNPCGDAGQRREPDACRISL